jgi:hypothetical protein
MRRTVSFVVCVLMAGFCAGLEAQIPENARFQPGSYAIPYHAAQRQAPVGVATAAQAKADDAATDDESKTEWEKKFSPQTIEPAAAPQPAPYVVPHLTFAYNHWTHRFHVVPYEPGYAASPKEFPTQTSPLHIWVSSQSSHAQPSPQVQYMSYYDPDPVILPAEIRLRGSRFSALFTDLQPIPMPMPRPETAQPISPPARTRLGERLRQTLGPFVVR